MTMTADSVDTGCVHHWYIVPPDGRTQLPGVCRKCGAVREFNARIPDGPAALPAKAVAEHRANESAAWKVVHWE